MTTLALLAIRSHLLRPKKGTFETNEWYEYKAQKFSDMIAKLNPASSPPLFSRPSHSHINDDTKLLTTHLGVAGPPRPVALLQPP